MLSYIYIYHVYIEIWYMCVYRLITINLDNYRCIVIIIIIHIYIYIG